MFNIDRANFDWESVYNQKIVNCKNIKLAEFNYKLLNNILPCGLYVHRFDKKVSEKCFYCKQIQDSYHMLHGCDFVQTVWKKIGKIMKLDIKWKHIVIGYAKYEDTTVSKHVNFILTNVAYIIFKLYTIYLGKEDQLKNMNIVNFVKLELKRVSRVYKETTSFKEYCFYISKIVQNL